MNFYACLTLLFSLSAFAQNQLQTEKLIEAVRYNNLKDAKKAIEKGADVNSLMRDHFEVPLIIRAASHSQPEMLKLLIENKANVNALRPSDGNSALMIAARNNYTDVAKILLDNKININYQGSTARTALDIAANMNSLDVGRLLLAQEGIDMNNRMPFNCPLSIAARDGHLEFVKLILEQQGAKAPSKECIELAFQKATKFNHPEVRAVLESRTECGVAH